MCPFFPHGLTKVFTFYMLIYVYVYIFIYMYMCSCKNLCLIMFLTWAQLSSLLSTGDVVFSFKPKPFLAIEILLQNRTFSS